MSLRIAGRHSLRLGGGSLRRRVDRLLAIGVGVLLLLIILSTTTGIVAAVYGLRAVQARGVEPAAARLLAGMTDQQSGLLAYLNSRHPYSLLLYIGGQEETSTALRDLHAAAAGTAEDQTERRVEAAARDWERWAEGVRLEAAARAPVIDLVAIAQGQRLFGQFRAAQQDLVSQLEADSSGALRVTTFANWFKVVVVVVGAVVIAVLLRVSSRSLVRQGFGPLSEAAGVAGTVVGE